MESWKTYARHSSTSAVRVTRANSPSCRTYGFSGLYADTIGRALPGPGERWYIALSVRNFALIAMLRANPLAALPFAREAHLIALATGDRWLIGVTRHILGGAVEFSGDPDAA